MDTRPFYWERPNICLKRKFQQHSPFCFQPAEEGGGGPIVYDRRRSVWQVPCWQRLRDSQLAYAPEVWSTSNPFIMASSDEIEIHITGKGGHAAMPNECIDPVVIASKLFLHFKTIVGRTINPANSAVINLNKFRNAGTAQTISFRLRWKCTNGSVIRQ